MAGFDPSDRGAAAMADGQDTGDADAGDPESMRALRHTAERQQDEQREWRRTLDLKLIATFPINAALFALISTSLPSAGSPGLHFWILTGAAIVVFAAYLWYATRAYHIRDWSERPSLDALRKIAMRIPVASVDAWIATEIGKSIAWNEPLLTRKGEYTWRTFQCTIVLATIAVAIAIVARVA